MSFLATINSGYWFVMTQNAAHAQSFSNTANVVTGVRNFPRYSGTIVCIIKIGDKEISVVATCASSDNTIGPVTLHPYSNNMEFKFKTNAFGETVFRCTFNINNVEHKFVIFNNQRGIYGENCWILADGGPCLCDCKNENCYEKSQDAKCFKYDS
ncbi:hypothetical protein F8388_020355 [Cannabis sativa]|uniref:S-protein homolog n=1 Tax=Cannabis sativa TaxID=3483 RepID=A0A7J6HJA0_CANSA|nr:hypothetical protein F8388_020355 [Cannabis sativa]